MNIHDTLSSLLKGGNAPTARDSRKPDKSFLLEKIRQSELFENLPPENIEEMFSRMETVTAAPDEIIIREGDEGDYYYLLVEGTADVKRTDSQTGSEQLVARLVEPVGMGEEALISNAKRNATVAMTSKGLLMRLSKEAFEEYVKEPLLRWFSPGEAQKLIASGGQWIDVREAEKSSESRLHGSIAIPIRQIREKSSELEKEAAYVCYCENGRQSSTAAFLLTQMGFNAGVLRGGLQALKRAGIT
jgi:rhodanese-related sulfurtransferase